MAKRTKHDADAGWGRYVHAVMRRDPETRLAVRSLTIRPDRRLTESGQFHGPSGRDVRGEFLQHGRGQAHAQRGESLAEHALDLRDGSAALAAGQGTQHRLGVPTPLLLHLAAHAGAR